MSNVIQRSANLLVPDQKLDITASHVPAPFLFPSKLVANPDELFVYGTLTNDQKRKDILAREIPGERDLLPNFVKDTLYIKGEPFPYARRRLGPVLLGFVILIFSHEWEVLYRYETNAYVRKRVQLLSGKRVWAFLKNPFHKDT